MEAFVFSVLSQVGDDAEARFEFIRRQPAVAREAVQDTGARQADH